MSTFKQRGCLINSINTLECLLISILKEEKKLTYVVEMANAFQTLYYAIGNKRWFFSLQGLLTQTAQNVVDGTWKQSHTIQIFTKYGCDNWSFIFFSFSKVKIKNKIFFFLFVIPRHFSFDVTQTYIFEVAIT